MSGPTLKDWQDASALIDSVIAKERERCAKICEVESESYLQQNLDAMRKGIITHEHVEHSQICKGLARKIRGEK